MASWQRLLYGFFVIAVVVYVFVTSVFLGFICWKSAQLKDSVFVHVDCYNQLTEQLEEVVKAYGEANHRQGDAEWRLSGVMKNVRILMTDMERCINQSKFILKVLHEKGYTEDQKGHDDDIEWKFQLMMMKHFESWLSEMKKEINKQYDVTWKLVFKHESWRESLEGTLSVRKRMELKSASQSMEYPPQKSSGVTKEARSQGAANIKVGQDGFYDQVKSSRSLIFFTNIVAEMLVLSLATFVEEKYAPCCSSLERQKVAVICKCAVLYALCFAISFHHTPGLLFTMTSLMTAAVVILSFMDRPEENQDSVGNSQDSIRPLVA